MLCVGVLAGANLGFASLTRRGGAPRGGVVVGAVHRRPRRPGPSQICYWSAGICFCSCWLWAIRNMHELQGRLRRAVGAAPRVGLASIGRCVSLKSQEANVDDGRTPLAVVRAMQCFVTIDHHVTKENERDLSRSLSTISESSSLSMTGRHKDGCLCP